MTVCDTPGCCFEAVYLIKAVGRTKHWFSCGLCFDVTCSDKCCIGYELAASRYEFSEYHGAQQ